MRTLTASICVARQGFSGAARLHTVIVGSPRCWEIYICVTQCQSVFLLLLPTNFLGSADTHDEKCIHGAAVFGAASAGLRRANSCPICDREPRSPRRLSYLKHNGLGRRARLPAEEARRATNVRSFIFYSLRLSLLTGYAALLLPKPRPPSLSTFPSLQQNSRMSPKNGIPHLGVSDPRRHRFRLQGRRRSLQTPISARSTRSGATIGSSMMAAGRCAH